MTQSDNYVRFSETHPLPEKFFDRNPESAFSYMRSEGVSSTMFFTSNDKDIYLKMWIIFDIWCGKCFAISIGQIQPKLIYGLVTYGPNGL